MEVASAMCLRRIKRARSVREDSSIYVYIYIYVYICAAAGGRQTPLSPTPHAIPLDFQGGGEIEFESFQLDLQTPELCLWLLD